MGRQKARRMHNITALTVGTGMYQEVPMSRVRADIHVEPKKHQWMVFASFRVSEATIATMGAEGVNLDTENLVSIDGPGCYVCEQVYDRETASKPCPGDPN